MTIFLGPFGFLAAVVAVIVESWIFVKIFVGSFLIKGLIGDEVFEAVGHLVTRWLTLGPATTIKRCNTWTEIEKRCTHRRRRSSRQSCPVAPA